MQTSPLASPAMALETPAPGWHGKSGLLLFCGGIQQERKPGTAGGCHASVTPSSFLKDNLPKPAVESVKAHNEKESGGEKFVTRYAKRNKADDSLPRSVGLCNFLK
jgi:hypothetical protein